MAEVEPVSTRVFLDELWWDVRSRNMDWRYVRFLLPRLAEYTPRLHLVTQRSRWVSLRGNVETVAAAVGRRIGLAPDENALLHSSLDARELARSGADLVFTHRAYPRNAGSTPVVFQNAVLDPAMQRSYGVSADALQRQIESKRALFAQAAAVQLSTQAEVDRHDATYPELSGRFVAVPFFTPDLQPCSRGSLERHRDGEPVRLLFVGNHARRKGLDVLLEAYHALPTATRTKATLTIISNFDRSPMEVPQGDGIVVHRGMPYAAVMAEMARAHVLVNVARFESYGLVFVEAMSQGMVCLGPDWEVQRELFNHGRAGINLPCNAAALSLALEKVIEDRDFRYATAAAAWERFGQHYAPAKVAKRYALLFDAVHQGVRTFETLRLDGSATQTA